MMTKRIKQSIHVVSFCHEILLVAEIRAHNGNLTPAVVILPPNNNRIFFDRARNLFFKHTTIVLFFL